MNFLLKPIKSISVAIDRMLGYENTDLTTEQYVEKYVRGEISCYKNIDRLVNARFARGNVLLQLDIILGRNIND